jgi:NADH-quinone oxidoreductase subunit A
MKIVGIGFILDFISLLSYLFYSILKLYFFYHGVVSISQLSLLGFWSMIEFLLELGIGFIYVWSVGAIEWDI